jgi:hypothetical protein
MVTPFVGKCLHKNHTNRPVFSCVRSRDRYAVDMSAGTNKLSIPVHSVDKNVYTEEQQIESAKELERLKTECRLALLEHPSREVLDDVLKDHLTDEPLDVLAKRLRKTDVNRKLFERAYKAVATRQARAAAGDGTKSFTYPGSKPLKRLF